MKHKIEAFDAQGRLKTTSSGGSGITSLTGGGTGSDLSAAGPGVLIQATTGAVVTTETALDATRGGTEQTSVSTGDLLYGSGANAWSKLAAGANGLFLKLVGGVPAWASVFYQTLRDGGSDMTQRAAVNFTDGIGTTITLTDDGGGGETEVKVDLALDIQQNAVSKVATPDKIDFKDVLVEAPGSNDVHIYMDLPGVAGGRLTGSTGVPVTTADVTGIATLYYTPYLHDKISLYDGTRWKKLTFAETSISLSGLIKGVMYDIFGYDNSGTFALEALAWKKVTATNSPTAGASKTINLADTSGLVIGMEVTVRDGSNSEVTNITAVVASTSITVDNLANSYTLPDVYGYPTRATAVTQQNGVYVKSGATTRRLLGSIRISRGTTGQTEDSATERLIGNLINRVRKSLTCFDGTDSWTYNGVLRAANNSVVYGTARVGVVSPVGDTRVDAVNHNYMSASSNNVASGDIGVDSTTVGSSQTYGGTRTTNAQALPVDSWYSGALALGNHYLQRLEGSSAATTTWYGDNASTLLKCGLLANVEC